MKWGADYGPLTLHGQWWRMIVSTFLHFGIIHIGFNMFVLLQIVVADTSPLNYLILLKSPEVLQALYGRVFRVLRLEKINTEGTEERAQRTRKNRRPHRGSRIRRYGP